MSAAERRLPDAEDLRRTSPLCGAGRPRCARMRSDWPALTLDERREILRAGMTPSRQARHDERASSDTSARILVLFGGEAPAVLTNGRGPIQGWAWSNGPGSLRAAAYYATVAASQHRFREFGRGIKWSGIGLLPSTLLSLPALREVHGRPPGNGMGAARRGILPRVGAARLIVGSEPDGIVLSSAPTKQESGRDKSLRVQYGGLPSR